MAGTVTNMWKTVMLALCGKQPIRAVDEAPNKFTNAKGETVWLCKKQRGIFPAGTTELCLLPNEDTLYTGSGSARTKMVFGSGSTAPSATASNVSNPITAGLVVASFETSDGTARVSVENKTAEDIVVGEFGLLGYVPAYASFTSTLMSADLVPFLIYHHVFDAPFTLKANRANTLKLTMRATVTGGFTTAVV